MIEPDLRAFLEGGLGIHIGTRTSRLEPNGAHALAVKVEDDRLHLVVYLAEAAARRIVPDLRANGAIAVGFARPIDERACQIKGIFVDARLAADDERRIIEDQSTGSGRIWSTSVSLVSARAGGSRGQPRPSGSAQRRSSSRRLVPMPEPWWRGGHDRLARVAHHLLSGAVAGAAFHLFR
jgi:hypothetical protein